MTDRSTWQQLKKKRDNRAVKAGYERAALAYELAEQVRATRQAKGMTQKDLADAMGSTQSVVARLEAGGTAPSIATLQRVARALGVRLMVELRPASAGGKRHREPVKRKVPTKQAAVAEGREVTIASRGSGEIAGKNPTSARSRRS